MDWSTNCWTDRLVELAILGPQKGATFFLMAAWDSMLAAAAASGEYEVVGQEATHT